jgi:hypothetical protein
VTMISTGSISRPKLNSHFGSFPIRVFDQEHPEFSDNMHEGMWKAFGLGDEELEFGVAVCLSF